MSSDLDSPEEEKEEEEEEEEDEEEEEEPSASLVSRRRAAVRSRAHSHRIVLSRCASCCISNSWVGPQRPNVHVSFAFAPAFAGGTLLPIAALTALVSNAMKLLSTDRDSRYSTASCARCTPRVPCVPCISGILFPPSPKPASPRAPPPV